MNPNQPIAPTQLSQPAVFAKVQSVLVNFTEDVWGSISVYFYDANGVLTSTQQVPMTLAESQGWAGDDEYVLTLALQKLGINNVAI